MNIWSQVKNIPHGAKVIAEWLGDGGQVCDPAEAQRRADICLECAHNKQGLTLTQEVAKAVKLYLGVKNKLRLRVKGEKRLGACAVCTCQLRLLVHEPIDKVRAAIQPGENYPAFCWKIKTP